MLVFQGGGGGRKAIFRGKGRRLLSKFYVIFQGYQGNCLLSETHTEFQPLRVSAFIELSSGVRDKDPSVWKKVWKVKKEMDDLSDL